MPTIIHNYQVCTRTRFIPIEDAGDRMGLNRERVNALVSTGRLRGAVSVSDPQTTLIDVRSIDKLFEERRQMITVRMAAANLGITGKELFDLTAYGHLRIAGGPKIDGFPDTVFDIESVVDLYHRVERISLPVSETAIYLKTQRESSELMEFVEVKEQLQAKNLNFGRWLQAVIDGEVIPFKLSPMLESGFENVQLTHFAFRRDQIQQYFARNSPEPVMPISTEESGSSVDQVRPKKRKGSLLSEMTVFLMRSWDSRQIQVKLNEIGHCYDVTCLKEAAEKIFSRHGVRRAVCSDSRALSAAGALTKSPTSDH